MGEANINRWGPAAWKFLHTVAHSIDKQPSKATQKACSNFFHALVELLPCKHCRKHYAAQLQEHYNNKIPCSSRQALSSFLVDVHNRVNKMNGKSEMSYEDAQTLYEIPIDSGCPLCSAPPTPPVRLEQEKEGGDESYQTQNQNRQYVRSVLLVLLLLLVGILVIFAAFRLVKK